jgi:predicted DsbA family dithiol-disulfide isomerase
VAHERAAWLQRRFGAVIEWLPFDLHPEYPPEGIPRSELHRRYGADAQENVRRMVEACGYTYNPPPDVVPNSQKALEVTELARDEGLHEAVHSRVLDAYWSEAANIGDEETLLSLVAEAGLDRAGAAEALADGRYRERVLAATREANAIGINAIPAFVLDNRLLLVGAYPHEVFEQAFARLEAEATEGAL